MKKTISKDSQKIIENSIYHKQPITLSGAVSLKYPLTYLFDHITKMSLIATAHCKTLRAELPIFPSSLLEKQQHYSKSHWNLYLNSKLRDTITTDDGIITETKLKKSNYVPLLFDSCFLIDSNKFSEEKIETIKHKYSKRIQRYEISAANGPFRFSNSFPAFVVNEQKLTIDQIYIDKLELEKISRPKFYLDSMLQIINIGDEVMDLQRDMRTFKIFWLLHEQTKENKSKFISKDALLGFIGPASDVKNNSILKYIPTKMHPLFKRLVISTKSGYRLRYYNI